MPLNSSLFCHIVHSDMSSFGKYDCHWKFPFMSDHFIHVLKCHWNDFDLLFLCFYVSVHVSYVVWGRYLFCSAVFETHSMLSVIQLRYIYVLRHESYVRWWTRVYTHWTCVADKSIKAQNVIFVKYDVKCFSATETNSI